VIYVDRFGKDTDNLGVYKYYPVRTARFLSIGREGQQYYIRLKLLDFIYPKDIDSFFNEIVETLPGLPTFQGTPENTHDGYYAIYNQKNIFADNSKFESGDDAWHSCVNDLSSKTEYFRSSDERRIIFARLKLLETFPKTKEVCPSISNNPWYYRPLRKVNDGNAFYKVTMDRSYCFHMNYSYPIQATNTKAIAKLDTQLSNNIVPQTDTEIDINSRTSRIDLPFSFQEPTQHRFATARFKFLSDKEATTIAPNRSMLFEIAYPKLYWLVLIIIALLFATTSIFIATDLSQVENVGQYFKSGTGLYKAIAAIFQALILILLSRHTNKKFL